MLKRKVPIKVVKVKFLTDSKNFSVWQLLLFGVVFASIGGYIIYHSFGLTPLPEAPANLTETTLADGTVSLNWIAPSDQNVTGYKIYQYSPINYAEDDTGTPTSSYIGTTTKTNYQVTGLAAGGAYDFYVVAVDASGNASNPTSHILADTSAHLFTAATTGNSPAHCTPSASFPYCNPFGDQNCDNLNQTPGDTKDDCVKSCTGSSDCGGSCILIPNSNNDGHYNTGSCRPMTFETCPYGTNTSKANVASHTLLPTIVDQGVDYNVYNADPACKFNNPNPKDTESNYKGNAKSNTRIYAMGVGVIKCVAANPGNNQSLTLADHCPDTTNAKIAPGTGTYLVYKLTAKSGAAQGLKIYVAEDCTLASNAVRNVTALGGTGTSKGDRYLGRRWQVGDHVNKNSVLCELPPNGVLEMGWANEDKQVIDGHTTYGEVLSASYQCFLKKNASEKKAKNDDWSTAWGNSFNLFVQKADFNNLTFKGHGIRDAYQDCTDFRLQAKYKKSAWY